MVWCNFFQFEIFTLSICWLKISSEWAPLEASDALELLSPTFRHIELRRYAVSRLSHAKPEQILLYLPQLVQALKYERFIMSATKKLKVYH